MRLLSPWAEAHVRMLERECVRAGLTLRILTYGEEHRRPFYLDRYGNGFGTVPGAGDALGFVVWTVGPPYSIRMALDELRSYKKPVAVLDEEGTHDLASMTAGNRLARVFRFSSTEQPSRDLARFLYIRGHRSVAFISALHKSRWSRVRCDELTREFAGYGPQWSVNPFTIDTHDSPESHFNDGRLNDAVSGLLHAGLSADLARRGVPVGLPIGTFIERCRQGCVDIMQQEVIAGRLVPLFESALKNRNITAWVCAQDSVAVSALSFLKRREIAVPGMISVAGFDDSPDALRHDLTSVNFNLDGLVHAMLSHVRYPKFAPGEGGAVEIESVVMERGSSGRAR